MKKYLFLYAVLTTALLAYGYARYRHETRRLTQNQDALASGIEHYRTRLGQEAASVQALRLRCAEFERLRAEDAASIRRLGIKLRRLEAAAKTVTATSVDLRAPVRDTVVLLRRDTLRIRDTLETIPLARRLGYGRRAYPHRLGRLPRGEHRHPAAGRASRPAAIPLHPLGHEGPAPGNRIVESAYADRLFGLCKVRTVN